MKRPALRKKPTSTGRTDEVRGAAAAERRKFSPKQVQQPMMAELYRRAEAQIRKQPKNQKPMTELLKPDADPQRLLHELQVHQVELELQNEELRQARDEMEAGLEKYSDLYDFAPVGYVTVDPEGTIIDANLASASLLGVVRAALVKRRLNAFISPSDRSAFAAFLQEAFKSRARKECELSLLATGKDQVFVRLRALVSNTSQVCRMAMTDISEHKRAEDKIHRSEVRYRRLFEAAYDGVLLLDPNTRKITDANPYMTKLLGFRHDQLVGKELFEIGLIKDAAASQEMFRKLKQKHEVRYEDLPLKSQDGRHQEVEVVANLYLESGRAIIQCNIRDITERKASEVVMSRLAAIVKYSADGIVSNNLNGIITSWNKGAEKIFGYVAGEIVGTSMRRIIPADRQGEEKRVLAMIKRGKNVGHFETMRRTKSGRLIHVSITASPIQDAAGKVIGMSKVTRDITVRKQAEDAQRRIEVMAATNRTLHGEVMRRQAVEESLRQSEGHQTQLLEESRRMEEKLRQLSHQVLTTQEDERKMISRELHDVIAQTLTGINIQLAALKKQNQPSGKGLEHKITETQLLVENAVEIVHQFARDLRPAALDDLGLIPALHSFMKRFITRTGIRARLRAVGKIEELDTTRSTVLFRIAQEALTNVARHAQASRVDVSLQKSATRICMRIADDGKSFDVARVFKAGWGGRLGLVGMRERLEMVKGCFAVESTPGKGTTVIAHIPCGKSRAHRGDSQSTEAKT